MPVDQRILAEYIRELERPISNDRLEAYRPQHGSDFVMLAHYLWNIQLCEALYPTLDGLEISLRNSIHAALTDRFNTAFWFDEPNVLVLNQPGDIQHARNNLRRPETAGRIIAELRFSFWTTLLSAPYDQHLWQPNSYELLRTVFPELPKHMQLRHRVQQHYNGIRFLRNRVFHYEPIWSRTDLAGDHANIVNAIDWISPLKRQLIGEIDRFDAVYVEGREQIKQTLRRLLR